MEDQETPDLPLLIRLLSHPAYFPSSLHLRILLLAPLVENDIYSENAETCWAAWLREHGQKTVLRILGTLPDVDAHEQQIDRLWGIVILSNGKRCLPGFPMIDYWSSDERLLRESSLKGHVATPTPEGRDMFEDAYASIMQPTLRKWGVEKALMFGINRCWAGLVEAHNKDETFMADCTKMIKKVDASRKLEGIIVPAGYQMRSCSAEDCVKVIRSFRRLHSQMLTYVASQIRERSANPRPADYYQSRIHFSRTIVNQETQDLVAWALSHNDCKQGRL